MTEFHSVVTKIMNCKDIKHLLWLIKLYIYNTSQTSRDSKAKDEIYARNRKLIFTVEKLHLSMCDRLTSESTLPNSW
jgi:hypothetical protein